MQPQGALLALEYVLGSGHVADDVVHGGLFIVSRFGLAELNQAAELNAGGAALPRAWANAQQRRYTRVSTILAAANCNRASRGNTV